MGSPFAWRRMGSRQIRQRSKKQSRAGIAADACDLTQTSPCRTWQGDVWRFNLAHEGTDEVTELTPETLRAELAPITGELASIARRLGAIEPLVAGIPIGHRGLEDLRHQTRQIKMALDDLAAVQMTSGEAEALHTDVNKTL